MLKGRKMLKASSFHEGVQKEVNEGLNYKIPQVRLNTGFYYNDIKRFLEIFGEKQVKIIIFEEFILNPKEILKDVLEFLDVSFSLERFEPDVHNAAVAPKIPLINEFLNVPLVSKLRQKLIPEPMQRSIKKKLFKEIKNKSKMPNAEREFLKKYYSEDVKKLEKFFGRNLPWPNFSEI